MKKIITLLLVLTGMVSTASAKTIYLETNSSYWGIAAAKYTVGYWGSEDGFALFSLVENETTLYSAVIPDGATGMKIQRYSPSISDELALSWGGESSEYYWNTTGNIDNPANNDLITITGWGENNSKQCPWDKTTYSPTPSIATISSALLSGDWNWTGGGDPVTLTESSSNEFTGTLDLSEITTDQAFKLVINGTDWLGCTQLTISAADGLVDETTNAASQGNFILKNSTADYKTYDITATWVPNSDDTYGWTLSIVGNTPRQRVYSICGTITGDDDSNWHTDWVMEPTGTTDEYRLVKELTLTKDTYKYKLRTNGNWDTYTLPAGSGNYPLEIKDNGTYRFTWTANVSTHTLDLAIDKVVELGALKLATFSSNEKLNFGNVESAVTGKVLKAYAVNKLTSSAAILTEVANVPADNGVLLKGDAGKYYVPFGDDTAITSNFLHGAANGCNVNSSWECYILGADGLFHPANYGDIPAGKAYLLKSDLDAAGVPTGARSLSLVFDEESTGIESVKANNVQEHEVYNLAGQRIAAPTKGFYIVNGKKVMFK